MADRRSSLSLFTGAMGLDLGLERAGFVTRAAVEFNAGAAKTIRANRADIALFEQGIAEVTTSELLDAAGRDVGDVELVSAGPCCQAFSTAGHRRSMGDDRGNLFVDFLRVVQEAKPRFFVMENVRGLLSAAVRHRPLAERGPGFPLLAADEQYGSAFARILEGLRATGYSVFLDVVNAADLGVPQRRERLIVVGSRDGQRIDLPSATHALGGAAGLAPWVTLRDALDGLDEPAPAYTPFPPSKLKMVKLVPEGGNWRDLPEHLQAEALGGAAVSWGGRTGFFRRLGWDRPTPALTTRPDSKATMFCHPDADRPLSVREYARVQQFPDDWEFVGSVGQQYQQIGNAVPLGLGEAVGWAIKAAGKRTPGRCEPGTIYCPNPQLVERLRAARGTVLNPQRMRKVNGRTDVRAWMSGVHETRQGVVDGIVMLGG